MVHFIKGALGCGNQAGADLTVALVARDRFSRAHRVDFQDQYEVEEDPSAARAEVEDVILDRVPTVLEFELDGSTEGILTRLLKSLFGVDTITTPGGGVNSRDHTITLADTLGSASRLSFEGKAGTASHAFATNGVVQRLRIGFDQTGILRVTGRALCGKPEYVAAATAVTLPAVATRLSRRMATTTLFGLADNAVLVRSGFVEFERKLDEEDFTVNSLFRRDAEYGRLSAKWELSALYQNADHVRRSWGSATENLPKDTPSYYAAKIVHAHPTVIEGVLKHQVTADLPRSHVNVSKPFQAGDVILQTIKGMGTWDAGTAKAADVVVRNTLTSA